MKVPTRLIAEDLAVPDATFGCSDLTTFTRLDELGLEVTRAAARARSLSRRGLGRALEGIVVQHLTVARIAEGLGVARDTANDAALAEGKRVLIYEENWFDGVKVIGVDEHVWRHTRRGDKYVTVIIDLTRHP